MTTCMLSLRSCSASIRDFMVSNMCVACSTMRRQVKHQFLPSNLQLRSVLIHIQYSYFLNLQDNDVFKFPRSKRASVMNTSRILCFHNTFFPVLYD